MKFDINILNDYLEKGLVVKNNHPTLPISIWNYSRTCQYENKWDSFNSECKLLDKEINLRGRKEKKEYKEGYDTFHPAELSNEMLDDFKVILYEYRAALKKNNNASRKI